MVGRFSMTTRARARAAVRGMAADARGSSPSFALAPDQRRPDRAHMPPDGRVRRGPVHRRRAGAGLVARARADSAGRPARPDRSLAAGAGRRPLRPHSRTDLSHARFLGRGSGLQGPHGARRRRPNGSFGPERQGRPRSVRARAARRQGATARTRRARPAPARRRRRRALACGRQRFGRDPDPSAGRGARRAEARPTSPLSSAPPPRPWPAPPRRSTG